MTKLKEQDKPVKVEASRTIQEPSSAHNVLSPLVDMYEAQEEVVLVAETPGAGKDDITVQVEKGVLSLEARMSVKPPGEDYARTYVGFEPGVYYRAFALSDEIDRERITATVNNGVVTIHLPKAETAKTRKIQVKAAD
jgi:HSP20 family molecular chaperone IbpA